MPRALAVSLAILGGYGLGAALGYAGVVHLSPNQHDRAMEAIVTAFLATGPAGAALGAILGFVASARGKGGD